MRTEGTVMVRMTPEVIEHLFTRDYLGNRLRVEWGEADADGFHNPTISVDYTDNLVAAERARIRAAVDKLHVARTKKGEEGWARGFRDGRNDGIDAVLTVIEVNDATD